MKIKNTIPYIILQQGGSIKYDPTESQIEIPEIQGYKRQFSIQIPQGDSTEESKSPQIIYVQAPPQQPTTEEPVVTKEKTETKPDKTNWSDIKSVIIGNEGFMSTAKALFNEPNASIGYGFFNVLPDGRKITPGMTITRDEANKQLDIAINKLSNSIKNSLSKYNLKTSPEQLNVLIDLGYHAGAGTVDKLLKESNGDSTKIGSLLLRYATRAKYGDTSINGALEGRALRRSQAWNKYIPTGRKGIKLPIIENNQAPKVTDTLKNGDKTFTEMCAEFQNTVLRNSGYKTSNNAWNLNNADVYMSGYSTLEKPKEYNIYKIQKYNKTAANNMRQNLNPDMLDRNQVYVANMYYNGSPFQEQAYNEGKDNITGTHTGYVRFNPDTNRWEVTHNIHGTIHVDSLNDVLGSRGRYGVTALLKPQKQTVVDKIKDIGKIFGKLVYKNGPFLNK